MNYLVAADTDVGIVKETNQDIVCVPLLTENTKILTKIGQGGRSQVFLAMDRRLNKQWAVKEINKQAMNQNNSIVAQSLIAKGNLMKKLDHPSLPRIVDIIDTGKQSISLWIILKESGREMIFTVSWPHRMIQPRFGGS